MFGDRMRNKISRLKYTSRVTVQQHELVYRRYRHVCNKHTRTHIYIYLIHTTISQITFITYAQSHIIYINVVSRTKTKQPIRDNLNRLLLPSQLELEENTCYFEILYGDQKPQKNSIIQQLIHRRSKHDTPNTHILST